MTSLVVAAKALYSASAELLEMVGCFFVRQEIRQSPKKTQNPVVDLRVIGQEAQSESEKARSCKAEDDVYRRP